jgi:hypothetical protein
MPSSWRASGSPRTVFKRGVARRGQRDLQFPDVEALLTDVAIRQQALVLKAPAHRPDHALAVAVVLEKLPLNLAQHLMALGMPPWLDNQNGLGGTWQLI